MTMTIVVISLLVILVGVPALGAIALAYGPLPKKKLNQEEKDWWFSKAEQRELGIL